MTRAITSHADPVRIGFRALLGLRDGNDPAECGRIRAAQLAAGRELALLLLTANLTAMTGAILLLAHSIAGWKLCTWGILLLGIAATVTLRRMSPPGHDDKRDASLQELRITGFDGIALAVIWAVVPLVFCTHAASAVTSGLGLILAVLMTAASFALAPLAFATLLFLATLGLAIALELAFAHDVGAAAGSAIFTMLLMAICVSRARALVTIRAAELALEERNATVSLLLRESEDHGADWLWETDVARRVERASPRFAAACGLDVRTIDGMPFLQAIAGPAWETGNFTTGFRLLADKLKAREGFRDLTLRVTVAGQKRWLELAASPRFDEHGEFVGFRGVGSDITEQRESADKINRMARFDALTGLPNRLMVNEHLARTMSEADQGGGHCAFMMLDLDRFKAVNDTLGHPIGDRLLGRVSERLNALMGDDTMCGRLGGDEFAVIVRNAHDRDALDAFAQRIIDRLSSPYELDDHTLYIGASIGLAVAPHDGRSADLLVRAADLALYRSKDAGGGAFHAYEPQLHIKAEERRVLEMALRKALERGEMHLAYQPVVDAETGSLTGFEALLRWTSPVFGEVAPAKFIALAEDARLIGPIGEWVMRTACDEAARWPSHIRVAVNVSPDQLRVAGFVTTVASALANSGLSPERLELEVTESVFMHEGPGATKTLDRVLDLGVRLSLDDFGTGYSSLGYLSRTRFSTIKIDRSFVQGAATGVREAVAIIRAVVALATSLGMATTAEGVESADEHAMVQDLGCAKVQGYHFGRPLPVDEARALANRHRHASAVA